MPAPRLSRRTVLRGAGTVAIALPWLEAMRPEPKARAQESVAQRFVAVYQPGGNVMDRWKPSGTGTDFTLSSILEPLSGVRDKLLVLSGLDMKTARGEQHQAGIVGLLTGMVQGNAGRYVSGPSLDQVIAKTASMGKPRSSIEIAVRWATGKSHGLLHPINAMTFADDGKASPISPRIDPVQIFNALFGDLGSEGAEMNAGTARKKSILDFLDKRYVSLSQQLGSSDRAKLEEHLERIREMERGLESLNDISPDVCEAPELVDTSDYNPASGLSADDNGAIKDTSSDAAIPKVGKLMTDMLVTAMACDMTGVGTLQWSDTEAKHTFPWLGLSEHHHYYQHDGGFRPNECAAIATWYSEQHAYLLERMDSIDMGGHSLLDESVVFFGSEISDPPTHSKTGMPFMVAGGGGGLQGGRHLQFSGRSHNDLLLGILHLFGDNRDSFGAPEYNTGVLTELTG